MKRDLHSFKQYKGTPSQQEVNDVMNNLSGEQKHSLNNMEEALKKYQGKDSAELMGELGRIASAERSKGTLTNETLDKFANTVTPMLNDEQRRRLSGILSQLKQ